MLYCCITTVSDVERRWFPYVMEHGSLDAKKTVTFWSTRIKNSCRSKKFRRTAKANRDFSVCGIAPDQSYADFGPNNEFLQANGHKFVRLYNSSIALSLVQKNTVRSEDIPAMAASSYAETTQEDIDPLVLVPVDASVVVSKGVLAGGVDMVPTSGAGISSSPRPPAKKLRGNAYASQAAGVEVPPNPRQKINQVL